MDNTQPSTASQPAPTLPNSSIIVCQLAAGYIAYWEGFTPTAEWDVNAFRLGFGSDTEGPLQVKVTRGMTTTRDRALANLALRIPQYAATCQRQLGEVLWGKLGVSTQLACLDFAYNYGSLSANIIEAFDQSSHAVADAFRYHDKDNNSVNRDRRAAEAGLIICDGGQVQ